MNVDQLLHEAAPSPTRLRAHTERLRADVLTRATGTPRRRSRRPVRVGLAVAALASVGVGGVAYATGSVPALVTSVVAEFGRDVGVAPADQPEMTQFVDLRLPDGSRFAAWRGVSGAMWCTAYTDRWDGSSMGSGAAGCGDKSADYDLNRVQIAWAQDDAGTTYYPVLFGDTDTSATRARFTGVFTGTGERVDLTVPIDPATRAFATVLPGTNAHPWAYLGDPGPTRDSEVKVELLDADGRVLQTVDAPAA